MATESFLSVFTNKISSLTTEIIVAVIILLIGFIIARMLRKMGYHLFHEFELDHLLGKLMGIKTNAEEYLSKRIAYFVYAITIIIALNQLGVTMTVLYIILGAFVLILVVMILLSVKDFIPNISAGLKLSKQDLLEEGDQVIIGKVQGRVKKVSLLEVHLETKHHDLIVIPNASVMKETIKKYK